MPVKRNHVSYESYSEFPEAVSASDVRSILGLLGYQRAPRMWISMKGQIAGLSWRDDRDYRSYSGVVAIVFRASGALRLYTRTPIGASYWDILKQNETIRSARKYLGGTFDSDIGRGRYFPLPERIPEPRECGCHLAISRFGNVLFNADNYIEVRQFPKLWSEGEFSDMLKKFSPHVLSNNLLLPYLVAGMEDYFKSTYVALLRYSTKKEAILKGGRFTGDGLARVSAGESLIEEAFAENLSFQSPSAISSHFRALDPALDLEGTLRKPYRRRKESLFAALSALVERRHRFVHAAELNLDFGVEELKRGVDDLEAAVLRFYRRITRLYGWEYDLGWARASRAARGKPVRGEVAADASDASEA